MHPRQSLRRDCLPISAANRRKITSGRVGPVLAVALTISLALAPGWPAAAQQASQCSELQVLFLIDQSGSMSGLGLKDPPNDPNNLRFAAPRTAIELLLDKHVRVSPASKIDIALVQFGDGPQIGLGWTPITATTHLDAQQFLTDLDPIFDPASLGRPALGNTNFVRAFQYAASLFTQATPQVGDCPIRAIILLTDGKPAGPGIFGPGSHMGTLKAELTQTMPIPPYRLYVVAMNDKSGAYWAEMEPYWRDITGDPTRIGLVTDQQEVGKRFRAITDELTQTFPKETIVVSPLCAGEIVVPPYLQWVSFTFYKPGATGDHLQIIDEQGQVDTSRTDVRVSTSGFNTAIETIRIENPLPGRWQLNTTLPSATCDLEMRGITASGKVLSPPATGAAVTQFTRVPLEFLVGDSQGNPLPGYGSPAYDLTTTAEIRSGTWREPVVLTAAPGYRYSGSLVPILTGLHEVYVEARSQDASGADIEVLSPSAKIGTFTVAPPELTLRTGPAGNPEPQHIPIEITLAVTDLARNPITLEFPTTINATLSVEGQPVPLDFTLSDKGEHTVSYTPEKAGLYQLAYEALVTLPDGTQHIFGHKEITFDVYPTTVLNLRYIQPPEGRDLFIAIDPIARPTDLTIEFQIVQVSDDGQDQPISPDQVILGSSPDVFKVEAHDSRGRDVSGKFRVVRTARIGGFEAIGSDLGPDRYTVALQPIATIKSAYVWHQTSWVRTFNGIISPFFFALILGILAFLGLMASCLLGFVWAHQHPGRGTVYIYEYITDPDGGQRRRRTVFSHTLGGVNHHTFTRGLVWRLPCLIPHPRWDSMPKLIRRIELICPTAEDAKEGRVIVRAWSIRRKGPRTDSKVPLRSGSQDVPLIEQYLVAKDPDWTD